MYPILRRMMMCSTISVLVVSVGCGGTSVRTPSPPEQPPVITQEPASVTVPLSSTATLAVAASGSATLTYQWSENGAPIAGATSATYTTPALTLADSGTKFVVTVANSAGAAVSSPATITIGPRSPDPRDMRFKHVGFPQPLAGLIYSAILGAAEGYTLQTWQADTVGTPLEVGTAGICAGTTIANETCTWAYSLFAPPPGVQGFYSFYSSDVMANLESDVTQVGLLQNAVITTLDEEPDYNLLAYAYEQDQTASAGFVQTVSTVSDGALQSTVEHLGTQGSVVTAASVNASGLLDLVSYTWAGAADAVYDARSVLVTQDNVGPQAALLAASGYILTAIGGNGSGNFVLVGTKVSGDTLPRPFAYSSDQGAFGAADAALTVVGYVYDPDGNVVFGEQ